MLLRNPPLPPHYELLIIVGVAYVRGDLGDSLAESYPRLSRDAGTVVLGLHPLESDKHDHQRSWHVITSHLLQRIFPNGAHPYRT